ncbi:MAG: nucleoside recognition domain-containing protein [Candidatus Altiarchaeota archaeon]|nr:nucleoside recognition domain-containing protein [Candidatus Altiarchaeota archaeon]
MFNKIIKIRITVNLTGDKRWELIEKIADQTVKFGEYERSLKDILGDLTVRPSTGIPLAIAILFGFFSFFYNFGLSFLMMLLDPLFSKMIIPWLVETVPGGGPTIEECGIIFQILVGDPNAHHAFEYLGVLTSGLYVAIGVVLPAIIAFYIVMAVLEDMGYMARLATLIDTVFHKIGLHGFAVVPMLLSLGCNIPGVESTRTLETKKQRFMMMALLGVFIPCGAQLGVMLQVVPEYLGMLLLYLIVSFFIAGFFLNAITPGRSPEILMDVPPYRMPTFRNMYRKVWHNVEGFLAVAVPMVLAGVLIVNILYLVGVIDWLGSLLSPLFLHYFGVPKEVAGPLVMAFLRKDVAVAQISALGMTTAQNIISVTLVSIYFPCLATFLMILKEGGIRDLLKCLGILIISFFVFGGLMSGIVYYLGI